MTATVDEDRREPSPSLSSAWEVQAPRGRAASAPFPATSCRHPANKRPIPPKTNSRCKSWGLETQGWEKQPVGTGGHFSCPERQWGCFSSRTAPAVCALGIGHPASPAGRRGGGDSGVFPKTSDLVRVLLSEWYYTGSFAGITSPSVCRRRDAEEDTHRLHHGTLHSHHDQSNQFVPAP